MKTLESLNEHPTALDRLMTIDEVAVVTGLSAGTLYHFVSEGRIPVVRISKRCIRFRQSEVQRWLNELSVPERKRL
jgi:excisionase family DNA binding protein